MLSYTKAEQLIDEIDDDFIKGLLCAQLGMLHQKYYDYTKALESYELAYNVYQSIGATSHMWYAKYNIGYVYREMKQYEIAEELLKAVMSWSYDNDNRIARVKIVDKLEDLQKSELEEIAPVLKYPTENAGEKSFLFLFSAGDIETNIGEIKFTENTEFHLGNTRIPTYYRNRGTKWSYYTNICTAALLHIYIDKGEIIVDYQGGA
jgi:tetratricopeptide (TPR) repeat protein